MLTGILIGTFNCFRLLFRLRRALRRVRVQPDELDADEGDDDAGADVLGDWDD
jgi:hypothetical protein